MIRLWEKKKSNSGWQLRQICWGKKQCERKTEHGIYSTGTEMVSENSRVYKSPSAVYFLKKSHKLQFIQKFDRDGPLIAASSNFCFHLVFQRAQCGLWEKPKHFQQNKYSSLTCSEKWDTWINGGSGHQKMKNNTNGSPDECSVLLHIQWKRYSKGQMFGFEANWLMMDLIKLIKIFWFR